MQAFSPSPAKSLLVCLLLLKTVACASLDSFYCAINTERVKAGVPPLLVDSRIETAATRHAAYMASKSLKLSYITDDKGNSNPGERLDSAGYRWTAIAELLLNLNPPITYWLNDPDRRAAVLSKDFKSIGLGFSRDSASKPYYVLNLAASEDAAAKGRTPNCASNSTSPAEPFDYVAALNRYTASKKRPQVKEDSGLKSAARIRANELIAFYATASFLSAFGSTEILLGMGYPIGSYFPTENCYAREDSARFLARLSQRIDTIPDRLLCNSGYYTAEGPDDVLCTVIYFAESKAPKVTKGAPAVDAAHAVAQAAAAHAAAHAATNAQGGKAAPTAATTGGVKPATPAATTEGAKPAAATATEGAKPATPAAAATAGGAKPATPAAPVAAAAPAASNVPEAKSVPVGIPAY